MKKEKLKNGALITFHTKFSLKMLFTKPLRFVIQLFTASKYEHLAIYNAGKISHIVGVGVQTLKIKDFIKQHIPKDRIAIAHNLIKPLTLKQAIKLSIFFKKNKDLKYSALEAAESRKALSWIGYDSKNASQCTQYVADAYVCLGILDERKGFYYPNELLKKMVKLNLISSTKIRIQ